MDWTSRHITYSGGLEHADLRAAVREPRILMQLAKRNLRQEPIRGHRRARRPRIDGSETQDSRNLQIDWSFSTGTGHVAPNMFPAKFGFDTSATPSCASDFVVFGLNVKGVTGGQSNILGLNQLYSGTKPRLCNQNGPSVYFAYNGSTAAGSILTSPSLSLDGSKIAYVESAASSSVFHVLTWKPGDGSSRGDAVHAASSTMPPACTATSSCLVSVTYANITTTLASPWVDFASDKAFVAADDGTIARISCVFTCALNATPTIDWTYKLPIAGTDGARPVPSGPVYNSPYGLLFVTDQLGEVWVLNARGATPSLFAGPVMIGGGGCTTTNPPGRVGTPNPCTANGKSYGIPDSVILDASGSSEKIYVFTGNDGGQGPSGQSALVAQMNQDLTGIVKVYIGKGSVGLSTGNVDIHSGTFNDAYWGASPSTNGLLYVCGTGPTDLTPYHYWIGFANYPVMDSSYTGNLQRIGNAGVSCTPYGEFYNATVDIDPNIAGAQHDLLFSGLVDPTNGYVITNDISAVGFTAALVSRSYPGGISGQVIDNDSTSGQAASIYFGTLTNATVVKLTQVGLN